MVLYSWNRFWMGCCHHSRYACNRAFKDDAFSDFRTGTAFTGISKALHGPFYGSLGLWCAISSGYTTEQFVIYYLPVSSTTFQLWHVLNFVCEDYFIRSYHRHPIRCYLSMPSWDSGHWRRYQTQFVAGKRPLLGESLEWSRGI